MSLQNDYDAAKAYVQVIENPPLIVKVYAVLFLIGGFVNVGTGLATIIVIAYRLLKHI